MQFLIVLLKHFVLPLQVAITTNKPKADYCFGRLLIRN